MIIEARNLVFSYKKKSVRVLNGVNLTLKSGEIVALLGANGSGKTTLTKAILGLISLNSGEIYIDNVLQKANNAGARAERIGYLFQNPDLQLFAPTLKEELYFPFELRKQLTDKKRTELDALIEKFNLKGLEGRFPLTMSGGEKQRLALATVMSRDIQYLILDEPTSGIDVEGCAYISQFVLNFVAEGGGVLVITHDEDFLSAIHPSEKHIISDGKITLQTDTGNHILDSDGKKNNQIAAFVHSEYSEGIIQTDTKHHLLDAMTACKGGRNDEN